METHCVRLFQPNPAHPPTEIAIDFARIPVLSSRFSSQPPRPVGESIRESCSLKLPDPEAAGSLGCVCCRQTGGRSFACLLPLNRNGLIEAGHSHRGQVISSHRGALYRVTDFYSDTPGVAGDFTVPRASASCCLHGPCDLKSSRHQFGCQASPTCHRCI